MTSLTGNLGPAGSSAYGSSSGNGMRGLDPRQKHISGHHRFQQFTPEQMDLFQQLFGLAGPQSYLSRLAGGDQSLFGEIEAPALKQLGEFQSGLSNRFSGMGLGARHGSGHNIAQGQLAMDFAQQLQSQRQGLQRQGLSDLASLSNNLLGQQPYGLTERGNQPSFLESLFGSLAPSLGQFGGNFGGLYAAKRFGLF
jgi:hypothetical protein